MADPIDTERKAREALDAVTAERDHLRAKLDEITLVQDLAAAYVSGLPDDRRQRAEEALYSRLTATMRERDRLQKERNAYRAALVEAARHVGALVELVRDEAKEPE